jgi:glucoamylase
MKKVRIATTGFFSIASFMAIIFGCSLGLAQSKSFKPNPTFDTWRTQQVQVSTGKIFEALSQPDTAPGVVIASPSKAYPDYYYHWVRDAGLVMDLVVDFYVKKNTIYSQQFMNQKMNDYIHFSKKNQQEQTLTGLGEPKFYVDGSAYGLSWGRPQTDGPALRALTLIRWAHIKLDEGHAEYVKQNLYNNDFNSLIKADLEYVAQNWKLPSFDLWEEVKADHFFTSMVHLAALNQGAKLAQRLNDVGASDWYLRQAAAISSHLQSYMNPKSSYIPVSMNYVDGFHSKYSGLDIAVVLAVLRTPEDNAFVSVENTLVQKTLSVLISEFQKIYAINQAPNVPGVAIGRYPEDVYDGVGMSRANPWVLATMAVAEAYYKLSIIRSEQGSTAQAQELFELADQFYQRVKSHANPDHSLSEQMDRHSGYMVGARDLTWSHASVLKAEWVREKALQKLQQ